MTDHVVLVIVLGCCTFMPSTVGSASLPAVRPKYEQCKISERPRGCPQPKDCQDILELGFWQSGVYTVYVGPYNQSLEVYCELDQEGRIGWLVFQRRDDGFLDFYKNWNSYSNGFGNLRGEFWLGNHYLYLITSQKDYGLKVVLEDFNKQNTFAKYTHFEVAAPYSKYTLTVGGYIPDSTAGDSMKRQNGHEFSTYDRDYDTSSRNCAADYHGAWWYEKCHDSNLNGRYRAGAFTGGREDGVSWRAWKGYWYSLKKTAMMIAPL